MTIVTDGNPLSTAAQTIIVARGVRATKVKTRIWYPESKMDINYS
jgi:hypothetical protein